jgi:hypothetical protein
MSQIIVQVKFAECGGSHTMVLALPGYEESHEDQVTTNIILRKMKSYAGTTN